MMKPILKIAFYSALCGLLTACIFSETPKLKNSSSSLIRTGYVRICGPGSLDEYVQPGDYCPIARIDKLEDGKYRVVEGYGDDSDMFLAIDLNKTTALVQIDQSNGSFSDIKKENGGPRNYIYRLAEKKDANTFMVYSVDCTFPSETYSQLARQGIQLFTSRDCSIEHLHGNQFLAFFKTIIASKVNAQIDDTYNDLEQYSYIRDQKSGKAQFLAERKKWHDYEAEYAADAAKSTAERSARDAENEQSDYDRWQARENCIRSKGINQYADQIEANNRCGTGF